MPYSNFNDPSVTNGTFANGINDNGQIVGYSNYANAAGIVGQHGFLYSGGSFTTLDDPAAKASGTSTFPTGINGS